MIIFTKNYTICIALFRYFTDRDRSKDKTKGITVDVNNIGKLNLKDAMNRKVTMEDFKFSLEEIKPQFGLDYSGFENRLSSGFYNYTVKAFVVTPFIKMCEILVINVFEIIFIAQFIN